MPRSFAALCLLSLGACAAPMNAEQCRGADWYALGERDGFLYAVRPQIELYAAQCGPQVREAQYIEGWRDGYGRRSMGGMGMGGGGM